MTPGSVDALRAEAEQHAVRGDLAAGVACLEEVLAARPGDVDALLQLSYLSSLGGRYRVARAYAIRASAGRPRNAKQVAELAARLRTFNAVPELQACIARLLPLSTVPIPLLLALAGHLSSLNLQSEALVLLDEARRGDPGYPPTLVARGQVLTYLGRLQDAERELRTCIRRAPEIARAYWLLCGLRRQTSSENLVDAIRVRLAQPAGGADGQAELAYALHKSLDDLGDRPGAWRALVHACNVKRASLRYDPVQADRLFDALLHAFPAGATQTPAARPAGPRLPVFIVGMHRSGTTLLEQLLDRHPDVRGIGELYDFTTCMRDATDHHCRGVIDAEIVARHAGVDFAAVGAAYLAGIEWRLGREPVFTDKLPSNFLNIGFICRALPHARILHLVRDPMETCFSNLRELFSDANPFSYDQMELGRYFLRYRQLMAHWHSRFPGRILDVDYRALTRDTETVMRGVCAFLGMVYEPSMASLEGAARAIATASAVQARGEIVALRTPKWRAYAEELAPLQALVS